MIFFFFGGGIFVVLGAILLLVVGAGTTVLGNWILAHIVFVCVSFAVIYSAYVILEGCTVGRNTGCPAAGIVCSCLRGACTLTLLYLELDEMVFKNPDAGLASLGGCLIACLFLFGCEWVWNKVSVKIADGIGPVILVTAAYLALAGALVWASI